MHRHSAGQAERQPERESRRPWSRYAHLSVFIPIPPHPPRQPYITSPIIIGLVVSSKFLGRSGRSVIFDSFDQSDKTDLAESIVDSYGRLNPETPFMTLLMPRRNDAGSMGFGAIKDSFTPTTLDGSNGGKGVTIDLSKVRDAPKLLSQKGLWRVALDRKLGWVVNGREVVFPESIFEFSGAENMTFAFDTGFPTTIVRT
jgi:hypothetical protein